MKLQTAVQTGRRFRLRDDLLDLPQNHVEGILTAEVSIRLAETETDFEAARELSYEWARSHIAEFPEHRETILKVFEPNA
ncbi:MAG: hypothetical protein P8H92_16595 [Paracoccaceae bacterium]|nr:hypothetical protein [Paracoccaceae bacterium]MDG1739559.1 hypothetical protein [Paracoccaceae bacterium]